MDTHEKLPELTEVEANEIAQQSINASPLANEQASKSPPFHFVIWLYKWFQANSFAPGFLSGIWSQPILGYLVAFVGQLVIVMGLLVLFHTYPSFRFLEGPMILFILLVALGWGAGPAVVALLVGAVMLIFFVFPPAFLFATSESSEIIELLLYLAVGLTISILASNTERARRASEKLRLRLDTIIDAIPDSIVLFDLQGKRIQQNRVAREMREIENLLLPAEELPDKYEMIDAQENPFPPSQLTHRRVFAGEREAWTRDCQISQNE